MKETTCAYESAGYECREAPLHDSEKGFCIFHEPGKADRNCEIFEERLKLKLKNKDYDFTGYAFPKEIDFTDFIFDRNVSFRESIFLGDAVFAGSIFEGNASFVGSSFRAEASFKGAAFRQNASFDGSTFCEKISFGRSTFGDGVFFRGSVFAGQASFKGATFKGETFFWKTAFKGKTFFGGANFRKSAYFRKSTFRDDASFEGLIFQGGAFFEGSAFHGLTSFAGSIFKAGANAHGVHFKKRFFGELLYRAAKAAARTHGEYREEGYYHQKEMDALRRQMKWIKRGWNFVFQKLLHGYGEKPGHVAGSAVFIILIFSGVFSAFGIQEQGGRQIVYDYWTCLYYSVVTFTTLGYGDFQPMGITRAFAAMEALTGAFLMALFVVTFARRWKR